MFTDHSPGFINVDELIPQIKLDNVCAFYGVPSPEVHRVGQEIRMRCFLNCGKSQETGDRAIAMQESDPARKWRCHQYGCGKGGNLISFVDLLKPGPNGGGRPRGPRFREIAADLRAMVQGVVTPPADQSPALPAATVPTQPKVNLPLARSGNERARALVELDRKFVVDPAGMPPPASAYFRRRPFLSPEVCRKWRMGYLPRDAGEDKTGGTMRGNIVYPLLSEAGEVLTWFGRDPTFEEKHRRWVAAGRVEREPDKFHFVKGFHRGLELFGQQASRLQEPGVRESLESVGLVVVEGPNDVIALDRRGVPAVGLCSNLPTGEQVSKVARFAQQVANGRIVLMLDCDPEGEVGAKASLYELAQRCDVRLAWSSTSHAGVFRGRQPESLMDAELAQLLSRDNCRYGNAGDQSC